MESFGLLNWAILVIYLAGNIGLGFAISRNVSTADDFYIGRRTTPWWAIGISVIATYVSALSFLGGPAWVYSSGMSVLMIHINYPLVVFIVVTYFLPFFYNSGVASIYEYQERRFGPTSRSVMSGIFLISQALTSAAILYATALVLEFITGIDVLAAILIVSAIALVYTMLGGITAVIWTDVIQAAILFVGAFLILAGVVIALPMPIMELLGELSEEGKLQILDFSTDLTREATVWSGIIAMTLFHVTVYGANQMMVQRTLAARNIGDAKKSFLMMGFAAFFIYFLFMFLGLLFYGYYEGESFENDNTIILQFAASLQIPGLMGVLAAAVIAASMSSLDSSLNSMATVSTVDFWQRYIRTDLDARRALIVSRWFTVLWALLIIIPAILYSRSDGSVLQTLSQIGSWFVGAKLSMFGLGFFSRHASERGVLVGVAVGFVALWLVATNSDIAWPWYCLIGGAVNIAVSIPASLLLDGRQADWSAYTVRGQQKLLAMNGQGGRVNGWHQVPGRVDDVSWYLLAFFLATLVFLYLFEQAV